jgi:hypothetical protein
LVWEEISVNSLTRHNFYWAGGIILLALGMRFFWLFLLQNQIGFDPVHYLWISEHVMRGDYKFLPQLWTTPLLPGTIGLAAQITGNPLWTGRIIGILGNTLAVGLAILLIRRLFPLQPWFAWLTGLGLAVNHVWCRTAVFIVTENFFYPLLLLLLLIFLRQLQALSWAQSLAFGAVWALLYLARDIGLYCGLVVFLLLVIFKLWESDTLKAKIGTVIQVSAALPVLAVLLGLWMTWFYHSFGIVSWGEGHRFYGNFIQDHDVKAERNSYHDGLCGWNKLRPYEKMEYTRFPKPDDSRYPPSSGFGIFLNPKRLLNNILSNLGFGLREFQRLSLIGFITILVLIPLGLLARRLALDRWTIMVFLASCSVLGLHLLGPAWDARAFAWFFPWIYLGLAAAVVWLWHWGAHQPFLARFTVLFRSGIVLVFLFTLLYPQYFKEVPQLWRLQEKPHSHQLAAELILTQYGPQAIISSFGPEVAYKAKAFWIGQPSGSTEEQVEWLYLGGANYFLIDNAFRTTQSPNIFWDDLEDIQKRFPELNLVGEFSELANKTYGSKARLFKFQPQPEKFAALKAKYPWAGTHPRDVEAMSCPPAKSK